MSLTKKNYQIVADELEKMIEQGVLRPGSRISTIDTLAAQYGVGKSTIREALSQLKARGLIESRQGEGTYVKKTAASALKAMPPLVASTPQELQQLLQVRKVIESGCAELAALHHKPADITRLQKILEHMSVSSDNEEMSRIYDIHFHMALSAATQNLYLQNMMESISEAMNHSIRDSRNLWIYSQSDTGARLYEEHLSIFEAVRARDPEQARTRILQHLTRVEGALDISST